MKKDDFAYYLSKFFQSYLPGIRNVSENAPRQSRQSPSPQRADHESTVIKRHLVVRFDRCGSMHGIPFRGYTAISSFFTDIFTLKI